MQLYDFGGYSKYLFIRVLFGAYKIARQHGNIGIYCHFTPGAAKLIANALPHARNRRAIYIIHTDLYGYFCSTSGIKKLLVTFLIKFLSSRELVFTSKEALLRAQSKWEIPNARWIPNIIRLPRTPPTIRYSESSRSCRLLMLGRLQRNKNIDRAVLFIRELTLLGVNVSLDVYGEGDSESELAAYIDALGVSDRVTLKGATQDIDATFEQIDALLMLSDLEGFSLVIAESLVRKRPVFSVDCHCGPRELLAPRSDPLVKTTASELCEGGMLVEPVESEPKYRRSASAKDHEIVQYLIKFIRLVVESKFTMKCDLGQYTSDSVGIRWIEYLSKSD